LKASPARKKIEVTYRRSADERNGQISVVSQQNAYSNQGNASGTIRGGLPSRKTTRSIPVNWRLRQ
jgi:hypothetical protein